MLHFTSRLLTLLSLLTLHSVAQAASMTSPKIELTFQSRDGFPVQGVSLAGILQYEVLTLEDCSGFICVPSLPKYKFTANAAEILGETDANGVLKVPARGFQTSNLTARKLQLQVFTNGLIKDVCNLNVLPQFIDGRPVERNPECKSLTIRKGETSEARILCYSPYSHTEIEEMKAKQKANCSR